MDKRLSPHNVVMLVIGTSLVFVAAARSQNSPSGQKASAETKTDPKINAAFERPDVKAYIKRFESDDREVYARRHEIVAALGLKPGMSVADIGAGTGLFTRLIAEKVGPTGKVYAVDIAPEFLAHIAADAKKHGRKQVVTVRGNQDTTNLPEKSLDLVFMSDVYHHLEHPEKTLASLRKALKAGGAACRDRIRSCSGPKLRICIEARAGWERRVHQGDRVGGVPADDDHQTAGAQGELLRVVSKRSSAASNRVKTRLRSRADAKHPRF